jgi:hypothetical protein
MVVEMVQTALGFIFALKKLKLVSFVFPLHMLLFLVQTKRSGQY